MSDYGAHQLLQCPAVRHLVAFYRSVHSTLGLFALGLCALVTALSRTSLATGGTELAGAGGIGNRPVAVGGTGEFTAENAAGSVRGTAVMKAGSLPSAASLMPNRVDAGKAIAPLSMVGTNSSSQRAVLSKIALPPIEAEPPSSRPIWREPEVVLTVDVSFLAMPYAMLALRGALDAWTSRSDALPKVNLKYDAESPKKQELEGDLRDHRLFFAPFGDARAKGALAVTLVTADEGANTIMDADILVNGGHHFTDVTTADPGRTSNLFFDLQNVLTHEFGHWFGLDEDLADPESTMFAFVYPGETKKRDLTEVDAAQVQWAYLNAEDPGTNGVGCALSRSPSRPADNWVGYLAMVDLLRRGRRRWARRQLP